MTNLTNHERRAGSPFYADVPEGANPYFEVNEDGERVKTYTWPGNANWRRGIFPEVIVSVDYDNDLVSARYERTGRSFTLPRNRADEAFNWARMRWEHVKMTS